MHTTAESATVTAPATQIRGATGLSHDHATYLRMTILGKRVTCLLDTGSEVSLLPTRVVGKTNITPSTYVLKAANGTPIKIRGKAGVERRIGAATYHINGFVSDQVAETILGMDFLREHEAIWNLDCGEIILAGMHAQIGFDTKRVLGQARGGS